MVRSIYRNRRARQARNRRKPMRPAYAAIDLGTNNCRLLIAERAECGFTVIDGFSRIVRLDEGVGATGRLKTEAMDRTIDALKVCARKMARRCVGRVKCVATEACRRADNGGEFLDRVKKATGLRFDIITPDLEARLTLAGCRPLLCSDETQRALLFDIGGGSTEVQWVETSDDGKPEARGILSIPVGVVTLAEEYGEGILESGAYGEISERIAGSLEPFCREYAIRRAVENGGLSMVGTSGTVTTLGAIYLGLERYDRSRVDGLTMGFDHIHAITARLADMDIDTRRRIPCVGPERADLMVMGCAILEAICRQWPVGTLRAADRGIREGLLLEMMEADSASDTARAARTAYA